ncbi:hypothetical protein RG47T_1044 [Mucilaginibacter polytrichastri]|uniref:Uncharacterized protein n=1 Tax=Mucilaginibacter polytrichastri TaxID=1302689 RepID=A0A1Q5ZV88_9SPHI|nr:hypothetical protein RG47T_1044 [Mucilaginibacter polytrichastri]
MFKKRLIKRINIILKYFYFTTLNYAKNYNLFNFTIGIIRFLKKSNMEYIFSRYFYKISHKLHKFTRFNQNILIA